MNKKKLLQTAINAAFYGGKEILSIYNTKFNVEYKKDQSPLTEADKRAHKAIMELLLPTKIPILSEEGKEIDYNERKNWSQLWIVDPLDGTKEFIKRNGEFTVNIALVEENKPIMGVIYVPVTKELYFSDKKAYKIPSFDNPVNNLEELLKNAIELPIVQDRKDYVVVGSRSHMSKETEKFIQERQKQYNHVSVLSKGSSLKLCMVAEGKADSYPRFNPTMEWDTAAGEAIVNASGAKIINLKTKQEMFYNKENLLNDSFLVER